MLSKSRAIEDDFHLTKTRFESYAFWTTIKEPHELEVLS